MKARSVITGSILVTVILGTLNSLYKKDSLPGLRFYFGNGVLFLMLTLMAEWEEEIAKTLALAVATFVVIGEGGGVLDHFLGSGASNHTLDTRPPTSDGHQPITAKGSFTQGPVNRNVIIAENSQIQGNRAGLPTVVGAPLFTPLKPILPPPHN